MAEAPCVHITGASGAGVSTVGKALAADLGVAWFDTDDFFWQPTEPPYRRKREIAERLDLLSAAFADAKHGWILSGAIEGWGDPLIPLFSLVVLVQTPTALPVSRLRQRELERFGPEFLASGGAMHANHEEFIAWAAGYDEPYMSSRNRQRHDRWLRSLPCPVAIIDGDQPVSFSCALIKTELFNNFS